MTRDEISAADEAVLRQAIKSRTGEAPVGRRTLEGLRVLAARAYGVPLEDPSVEPATEIAGNTAATATREAALAAPAGMRSISELIQVRILRDYWPREGDRLAAGSITRMTEAEAKPLLRDGVVEWL
ncbi:MAG: hypothetical protein J0H01_37305 [Rhizobiales bacterium]|nr:hypothetical protein [Hyphomicrobiales bacterium]